MKQNSGIMG